MTYRSVALLALSMSLTWSTANAATGLPPVKVSADNAVPACVTPGRLMALVKSKNDSLDPRFETIAADYMRHGEKLGVRWDYAFFQMLVETGHLSFRREAGRRSEISAKQNNFAGLQKAGGGGAIESFSDISTGVLAHLQHVMLYAGEKVESPVAERTRKVQEWGVLRSWQKGLKGPITYAQLAKRWANGEDAYGEAIEANAKRFHDDFCRRPDPRAPATADNRAKRKEPAVAAPLSGAGSGLALAKKAIEDGAPQATKRAGLGAAALAKAAEPAPAYDDPPEESKQPANGTANGQQEDQPANQSGAQNGAKGGEARGAATVQNAQPGARKTAAAGPAAAAGVHAGAMAPKTAPKQPPAVAAKADGQCRVFTASYGGAKAIIIRHQANGTTNFTVLDVNDGLEEREAEAYIAAYARGGAIVQRFPTQPQALERAFELCPEG